MRRTERRATVSAGRFAAIATVALAGGTGGCLTPSVESSLASADPSVKVPAIREAAADRDRSAVGPLIADLASDDAAVRLFAAEGLRRIAGTSFGYEPYADEPQREVAAARWREWAAGAGIDVAPAE